MPSFFHRLKVSAKVQYLFIKESFYLAYGVWKLMRLPRPRVSIFGGSKMQLEHSYAQDATSLSQRLVERNISVLNGGGPGIMQAVSCGAADAGHRTKSMGIGVYGLDEGFTDGCGQELIFMNHFFSRKWLLTDYSDAYVIFPGGYGTLDELAHVATLMQTKQMAAVPIVLIGQEYWAPLLKWVDDAVQAGLVKDKDRDLITVTDDIDEALEIVKECCLIAMQEDRD